MGRGKRSAEPSAEPHGYGFYGYHPYAHGLYHPYAYGHHVAHVAHVAAPAIAAPALPALAAAGVGVGGHPGGATSYSHRRPQGLRGKRSAEAEAEPGYGYGYYGYPAYRGYYGHGYYGHGLRGVAGYPSGTSYTFRSPQGLGK